MFSLKTTLVTLKQNSFIFLVVWEMSFEYSSWRLVTNGVRDFNSRLFLKETLIKASMNFFSQLNRISYNGVEREREREERNLGVTGTQNR